MKESSTIIKKRFKINMGFPSQVWRSFKNRKSVLFVLFPFLCLLLFSLLLESILNIIIGLQDMCFDINILKNLFEPQILRGFFETINNSPLFKISFVTTIVCLAIVLCRTLTDIYSVSRKEAAITLCQILILVLIGIWILALFMIFDLREDTTNKAILGGLGFLLALIFQDTIKGVVSFIHLRFNHQLHIDDWIQVPGKGVDGEVRHVSLTNVTISNWDTTTSCIPTSMLYSEHFINLKNMMDGKTFGRRMYMTFIFDTNWMHPLSDAEVSNLIARLREESDVFNYMPENEIKAGQINAQLFRLYLYHWLMNHPHISQQPRLIVRWREHQENGMPLQVYAFITDSSLASFEWQQSQIIEHIIKSLRWFGLRLYQNPSSFDVSNSNIFLTKSPANYVD
ncbi:MAG: mechanosensitive ion channel domain-containing protein [Candidatus Limisoma sp.]